MENPGLRGLLAMPLEGHNSWDAPCALSQEEWDAIDDLSTDEEALALVGTKKFELAKKRQLEWDEIHSKPSICRCGCGCRNENHDPFGSYCSACKAGCCGEW